MADALLHFDQKRADVGDFVVMANHVLLKPYDGYELENLLKSVKGFSARQLNAAHGQTGTVWRSESYDHIVRGQEDLERIQRYIAANPAKAGVELPDGALRTVRWLMNRG